MYYFTLESCYLIRSSLLLLFSHLAVLDSDLMKLKDKELFIFVLEYRVVSSSRSRAIIMEIILEYSYSFLAIDDFPNTLVNK